MKDERTSGEIWIRFDTLLVNRYGITNIGQVAVAVARVPPELFPPMDYTCTPRKEARIDTERNGDGSEASGTN